MKTLGQPSPVQIVLDQKRLKNVEYVSYLSNMITKSRTDMAKAAVNKKTLLLPANWN